jgi:elongator complex protein 1
VIVPHFQTYVTALLDEINEDESSFVRYKSRLQTIRKERLSKKTSDTCADEANDNYDDNCDLYSDTTMGSSTRQTASSKGTGKTFRSSKNRRKHERKLLNLKEGNQFEDIAIIDALHTLIVKCSAVQQQSHVKEILEVGIDLNQLMLVEQLQLQFDKLLKMMRDALDEIWLPEMMVANQLETSAATPVDFLQVQNQQHYAMISE